MKRFMIAMALALCLCPATRAEELNVCVKKDGTVYLIGAQYDRQTCRLRGETLMTLNTVGPQGPVGPTGPQGEPGEPGICPCSPLECSETTVCGDFCTYGGLTYGTIVAEDGNCWLDRNLGARQVADASDDGSAHGWLFQWGRGADGHQYPDSGLRAVTSSTDDPGHDEFIIRPGDDESIIDWRSPHNSNLWQGADGINNPCPPSFRVPTGQEWATLVTAADIIDTPTAFSSTLRLTAAGERSFLDGYLANRGTAGFYWASTQNVINPETEEYLYFFGYTSVRDAPGSSGMSVRCIR